MSVRKKKKGATRGLESAGRVRALGAGWGRVVSMAC